MQKANYRRYYFNSLPCHLGLAHPQTVDDKVLHIWGVARKY